MRKKLFLWVFKSFCLFCFCTFLLRVVLFSILDCASGFWQIPLDPATKDRADFITSDGIFEWNRLPFGLKKSPMAFQQTILPTSLSVDFYYTPESSSPSTFVQTIDVC